MNASIAMKTEVVAQVAHRFSDHAPALTCIAEKFPTRTVEQIEAAADELHEMLWAGTLATYHRQLRV